jgi:hypothetical protein
MTDELKPCPFCGGAAELRSWDWPYVRYQVRCSKKCNGGRKAVEADAIAAWNTRQPNPAVLVEALKTANAWLERWADHVGNCDDAPCTCGLTRAQYETSAALAQYEKDKAHG